LRRSRGTWLRLPGRTVSNWDTNVLNLPLAFSIRFFGFLLLFCVISSRPLWARKSSPSGLWGFVFLMSSSHFSVFCVSVDSFICQTNEIPKSISRLKTPKDSTPTTQIRPPRRSRSSRFNITDGIELEKLPNFSGLTFFSFLFFFFLLFSHTFRLTLDLSHLVGRFFFFFSLLPLSLFLFLFPFRLKCRGPSRRAG